MAKYTLNTWPKLECITLAYLPYTALVYSTVVTAKPLTQTLASALMFPRHILHLVGVINKLCGHTNHLKTI